MNKSILVIDDYCSQAQAVRDRVLSGELQNVTGPHGELYTNISRVPAPELESLLAEALGFEVVIRESGFRYDLKGEFPHNHAHADTVCAEYAAIVYLNPDTDCKGGTGFWKHKGLGIDRMPTGLQPDEEAVLVADWSIPEKWKLASFVGMKFNRLLVYPTSLFHSRYPHEGFGVDRSTGRLIWIAFFSKK